MAVVELENVTKQFGDVVILKDVNLAVEKGEIVGIIGYNGCGKTILMKMVCGLMLPSSGSVTVFGKKIGVDRDFSERTGVLIETPEFLPYQSAFQNLYGLSRISGKVAKADVCRILERVGLDPGSKKRVEKYSLGMRQRLGIAQAILDDPALLLLDEPMNALDKNGVSDMRELFLRLRGDGKTIILASHSAEDIAILCDSVYEISNAVMTKII